MILCSVPGCRRKCHEDLEICFLHRRQQLLTQARAIVQTGMCPQCGTGLVRNMALAGWYLCGAYAAESHRLPEYDGLPQCHFQTFTRVGEDHDMPTNIRGLVRRTGHCV
jgi:hypothetical protein